MATDQQPNISDFDTIRYPSEILSALDAFVSSLRKTILERAGNGAIERSVHGSGATIVSTDDLIAATRATIPNALTELEKAMSQTESSYARRAS